MKAKNIILIALLLVGFLTSCKKDFLTKENPNQPTADQFWRNETDALASIYATYAPLNFQYRYGFFEFGWGPENWKADDLFYGGEYPVFYQISNYINTPEVYELMEFYNNAYQYVNRANQSIEGIPLCTMDENLKTEMVAEAKFFRAFGYFKLLRNFQHIPFYERSPQSTDEINAKQADRSVVWALIESDFRAAVDHLPASRAGADVGRVTKGAAAAFLGYAYLYQQKYSDAATILSRIENAEFGSYSLLPIENYSQNWDGSSENNQESLWEIQMHNVKSNATNILQAEFLSWQESNASTWIFNQYVSETALDGGTDPRYYKSMISPTLDFNAPLGNYSDMSSSGNNLILKHTTDQWVAGNRNENNYPMMRYADVLLMLAEAVNETSGPDAALPYINQVRERALMPAIGTGLSKESFREKLMHERAVELSFESRRWYDLVRWHEAGWINIKQVLIDNNKPGAANFDMRHLYYPIPEIEYEVNPNLDRSKQW